MYVCRHGNTSLLAIHISLSLSMSMYRELNNLSIKTACEKKPEKPQIFCKILDNHKVWYLDNGHQHVFGRLCVYV